jgi:hypothetical protein
VDIETEIVTREGALVIYSQDLSRLMERLWPEVRAGKIGLHRYTTFAEHMGINVAGIDRPQSQIGRFYASYWDPDEP